MTRASAFGLGLITVALFAWGALGQAEWPLCAHGHPAKRPPDCTAQNVPGCITYGGLAPRHGFQRDHFIPEGLCRGQPWCDVAAADPSRPPSATNHGNVWYQPIGDARVKDAEERRLEEGMCAGRVSIPGAAAQIEKDWGR